MADRKSGALFAADGNFVLLNQLSNVFESDWSLIQRDVMVLRQRIDHIGGGNRLSDAIFPATAFHQVIEQDRDNVIRLNEGAILVYDSKTISITVGRYADAGAGG